MTVISILYLTWCVHISTTSKCALVPCCSHSPISQTPPSSRDAAFHHHDNLKKETEQLRAQLLSERAEWEGRVEEVREEGKKEVREVARRHEEKVKEMKDVIERLREMVSRYKARFRELRTL